MNTTPYYAPSYFSPTYFDPATASPTPPTTGPSPYYAPTYFSTSYFASGKPASIPVTPPVVVEPQGRDQAAYAALVSLLEATGAFEQTIFGNPTRRGQAGAGVYPLAVLTPKGWDEADDYDPTLIVRHVLFTIRIVVRSDDEDPPFEQLDELASAVQGVVDRSSLNGTCVPALTKIRAGRYEFTTHYPEQCIDLDGEFFTLFDPATA